MKKSTTSSRTPAKKAPAKAPAQAAPVKAPPKATTKPPLAKKPQPAPAKPPKDKLVRDSFTIPKSEYESLQGLKERATKLASPAKKSELLRAGVALLKALPDKAFLAALGAVPSLKTGRPKGAGKA
jgi:hypothetical protein